MPRSQGTSRKGKPGKFERTAGMGKALQRSTRPKARQKIGGMSRQVGVDTIGEIDEPMGNQAKSILERNDLDDFLHQADMANREFSSEKQSSVVLDSTATFVVPTTTTAAVTRFVGNTPVDTSFVFKELSVPRRPAWDETTTKQQLDDQEKQSFLEWRRAIAQREEQLLETSASVTPFEKNIEVWRQLWRVLERSACLLQILDARNPLFYLSEDLKDYANSLGKPMMVLINKADYLTALQRQEWCDYLTQQGWEKPIFFSAVLEQKKLDDWAREERRKQEAQLTGNELDGIETIQTDSAENSSDEVEAVSGKDDGGITHPLTRQELIDALRQYAQSHDCRPDPRFDNRIQFGMVGFPNVGKSSVINVLIGSSKHTHGKARVAVASQPGKTKHFQTLLLSDEIMLCDCPGLVFPSFVSNTADLIAAGVYPIAQMRHFWPVISLICERIPKEILQAQYGIKLRSSSPEDFLDTYCIARSFLAASSGVPDHQRASRLIIKDYADGKLLYCHPPPESDKENFQCETLKTALRNAEKLQKKLGSAETILESSQPDTVDTSTGMSAPDDAFLEIFSDEETDEGPVQKHGKISKRGKTPKQKWGKKDRKNRNKDPYGCHSAQSNGGGVIMNAGKYSQGGYTRPTSYPSTSTAPTG